MNKRQTNHQTMHFVVLETLADNQPIIAAEPLVAEVVTDFKTIIDHIIATNAIKQTSDTGGYTANKNKALDAVFTLAVALGLKAKAYARKVNDAVLLKAVDYSSSTLHNMPESNALAICNTMVTAITPHLDALLPYKITADNLANLQAAMDTAIPLTAKRDTVDNTHTQSTATLTDLFKQAGNTLDALDDLIEGQLNETHPDFVAIYFIARRINSTRGGGKSGDGGEEKK